MKQQKAREQIKENYVFHNNLPIRCKELGYSDDKLFISTIINLYFQTIGHDGVVIKKIISYKDLSNFTNDIDFYVLCKLYNTNGVSTYVLNEDNTSNIWLLEDKNSEVHPEVMNGANDNLALFGICVKCFTDKKAKVSYECIDLFKNLDIIYPILALKLYLCDRTKTPNLPFDPLENYYVK